MKYKYLNIKINFLSDENKEIKIKLITENQEIIDIIEFSFNEIIDKKFLLKNYLNFDKLFKTKKIKRFEKTHNFVVVIEFNQLFFELVKKYLVEEILLPYNKHITKLILNINNIMNIHNLKYEVINKKLEEFKLNIENLKTNILFDFKIKNLGILDIDGANTELLKFKFNLKKCYFFQVKNLKKFSLNDKNFLVGDTIERLTFEDIESLDFILKKQIHVFSVTIRNTNIKNLILNTTLLKKRLNEYNNYATIYLGVSIFIESCNIETFFVNGFKTLEISKNTKIKNIIVKDGDLFLITNNNKGIIENADMNIRYLTLNNTVVSVIKNFDNINIRNLLKFQYNIKNWENYEVLNLYIDCLLYNLEFIYKYNISINFIILLSSGFYNNFYENFYNYIFALIEKKLEKNEIIVKILDFYLKHSKYLKNIYIPESIKNTDKFKKLKKKPFYMVNNII